MIQTWPWHGEGPTIHNWVIRVPKRFIMGMHGAREPALLRPLFCAILAE